MFESGMNNDDFDARAQSAAKDSDFEGKIRPQDFKDFSGQDKIIENLKIFVKAALLRGEALDHILLHGPPGLGKTTLAHIVANELGVNMKITSSADGTGDWGRAVHRRDTPSLACSRGVSVLGHGGLHY